MGLRRRVGLAPAPAPLPGDPDRGLMARALMYLFLAGGAITLGSLLLPEAVAQADRMRMTVMAASAFSIALVLFAGYDRLPRWSLSLFLACGTLLIEWTVYASGENTSPYVMFWFWLAIYAFYFLPRWQALGQLAFMALAYAVLLTLAPEPESAPVVRWAVTTSALIVAGAMIGMLKERVDRLIAELQDLSRADVATGLLNRRAFMETLERATELARRTNGRVTVAVGELTGQGEPATVAPALLSAVGASDVAARIEERRFAVVAPGTSDHGGYVLAERVQEQLRGIDGMAMSFGVACFPDHADSAESLLAAAQEALAEASALGLGRVVTCGVRHKTATA